MKCIKDKCPNYFQSHAYKSCYLLDKFMLDDECLGEEKIKELLKQLEYVKSQLEIVRKNQ